MNKRNPSTSLRTGGFAPIAIILIVVGVLVLAGGVYLLKKDAINGLIFRQNQKACTMEAKLCPDGSYVSRTGPNCEFTACSTPVSVSNSNSMQACTATSSVFTVGKNGGTIISPDEKMKLKIPEGALVGDVTIKIAQSESGMGYGEVGPLYGIFPINIESLEFLKPATLMIAYDYRDFSKDEPENYARIGLLGGYDEWDLFADSSVDTINHVITTEIKGIYVNSIASCDGPVGVLPIFSPVSNSSSISTSTIDTSNWQTYSNYGFKVKYPPFLKVIENPKTADIYLNSVSFENPLADKTTPGQKIVFNVTIFKDYNQLQDAFKLLTLDDKGKVMIAGYEAEKLFSPKGAAVPFADVTIYTIATKNVSLIFYGSDFSQISKNDLNTILSTFKFLK